MRLWSIHPSYLDSKGLVALWREGLLARNVLEGNTKGYKNHPQLNRFKKSNNPVAYINAYLHEIVNEAEKRNFNFNRSKLKKVDIEKLFKLSVNSEQIKYEFKHLLRKLAIRDRELYTKLINKGQIKCHPLFVKVRGDIEDWEVKK